MAEKSKIEWTEATWDALNPAETNRPLRWKKRRMVTLRDDIFHPDVPDETIDRIFAVMALCPQHTFQVLTKRAERMRAYLSDSKTPKRVGLAVLKLVGNPGGVKLTCSAGSPIPPWPLPNVWLGVSAENQAMADERIPHLLATPAAVRFLSLEPMLGAVDAVPYMGANTYRCKCGWHHTEMDLSPMGDARYHTIESCGEFAERFPPLDWVIVGGESGPGARPMHPDWVRSIRDQCAAAGVALFFKQWGEWHENPALSGKTGKWVKEHHFSHIWLTGELYLCGKTGIPSGVGNADGKPMYRVGKKKAGRLLDGLLHDGYPRKAGE